MAYDKVVDSGVLDSGLTSIANKIRSRSGGSNQLVFPTGFVSEIDNIPTGGGGEEVEEKDVNFYDYDGTVVASYTAAEFAALSTMPANPTHEGLTAQGWNWTLSDAKAYVQKYGELCIGQMYVTTSGDTELDVDFTNRRRDLLLGIWINGEVEINWGDGSNPTTLSGTSLENLNPRTAAHTYINPGKYTIKLHVIDGSFMIQGNSSGTKLLAKNPSTTTTGENRNYQYALKAVRLGTNVQIGSYAFAICCNLETITLPYNLAVTSPTYLFNSCKSLKHVTIPSTMTEISTYFVYECNGLKSISIPAAVTTIGTYALYNLQKIKRLNLPENVPTLEQLTIYSADSIRKIHIPYGTTALKSNSVRGMLIEEIYVSETVTSISANAFAGNYSALEYHFLSTTPPTLVKTTAFTNMPEDCIIYVPAGSLSAYQSATNWSTYASKMQEE